MSSAIDTPRTEVPANAPRFITIKINPDKIRDVIGSGGKVIKDIVARTGAKIDVADDGTIKVASSDPKMGDMAVEIIRGLVMEPEVGKVYKGKVVSIVEFGAFVQIMPNCDGLLHVSEIAHERVNKVGDYLKEGDELDVKVLEINSGKIRLSRKVLLERPAGMPESSGGGDRGGRGGGDRDRGGRGGDRGGRPGDRGGRPGDRGGRPGGSTASADRPPRQTGGHERHDTDGGSDTR
jgi:polyribonucleotide nucleotidyltransferase